MPAAALEGIRVIDLTNEWGLLAGSILADLGADVIQAEPPGGSSARRIGPFVCDSGRGEDSLFWAAYARNKRGISLNPATPEGRHLLLRLVERADILIESFAPGYLATCGLGFDVLSAANPRLIAASITPFGPDGPKAGWPATDLTILAASNYLLWIGDKDRAPLGYPFPQSYLHAAAEAATGCLAGLRERRRSGLGQQVDVSAQQALTSCTQAFILASAWNDTSPFRLAPGLARQKGGLSGVYPAADGFVVIGFFFGSGLGPIAVRFMQWVYEEGMCAEEDRDRDWVNFLHLVDTGEETLDQLDRTHAIIERFIRSKTKQALLDGALARGLMISPAFTVPEVLASPQLAFRQFWTPSGTPGDPFLYPGPFARFSGSPLEYRRRAPALGEHNHEVFAGELGLTGEEVRLLAARGAI